MIVIANRHQNRVPGAFHAGFEQMLPQIRELARLAFRFARPQIQGRFGRRSRRERLGADGITPLESGR
jgi:hypothetical protein